jgi:hypothetical protein
VRWKEQELADATFAFGGDPDVMTSGSETSIISIQILMFIFT